MGVFIFILSEVNLYFPLHLILFSHSPGLGRFLGGWNVSPLWYPCLENPMDRRAWQAIVHIGYKMPTLISWYQSGMSKIDVTHLTLFSPLKWYNIEQRKWINEDFNTSQWLSKLQCQIMKYTGIFHFTLVSFMPIVTQIWY